MKGRPMEIRGELRDLASRLAGLSQKPPFDYEGYRRISEELWDRLTEGQRYHWIENMEKMGYDTL
jgi:hypothetical protein